jgi:hypothetical protein
MAASWQTDRPPRDSPPPPRAPDPALDPVRDPRHPPPPVRSLLVLPLLVATALLGGCGSACEDLGDRVCLCQPPGALRENCRRAVEEQLDQGDPKPGETQQDFCEQKLRTCPEPSKDEDMCDRLSTPRGKFDCGLAYCNDPLDPTTCEDTGAAAAAAR